MAVNEPNKNPSHDLQIAYIDYDADHRDNNELAAKSEWPGLGADILLQVSDKSA